MTLFTGDPGLPFNTVARIMDSLLFEKKKILFRVSLAILKGKEKDLMMMKGAETMMSFITNDFRSPFWFDEDAFMKTVFALQLSRKDIEVISNPKFIVLRIQLANRGQSERLPTLIKIPTDELL